MKLSKKILLIGLSLSTVFSLNPLKSSAFTDYTRICGNDRVETSLETSGLNMFNNLVKPDQKNRNIVIADGYNFADSLSAMNIANKYDAKLILAPNTMFSDTQIKAAMSVYNPNKIFLVGGRVCNRTDVKNHSGSKDNIVFINGLNRYDTNRKSLEVSGYKNVGVASGENYADALSSYSLLSKENLGLLLVKPNENYNASGLNVKFTFGGPNSVKKDGGQRIAGNSRYDTSVKIAEKANAKNIIFVSGNNFADALSSINIVKSENASILLTPTDGNKKVSELAKKAGEIFAVGGNSALPEKNIQAAIDGKAIQTPVIKTPAKTNEKLIKNISGFNLAFKETPDISSLITTNRVDFLNENDVAFSMKAPEKGYLFTIYVSDYVDSESDGFHERNIGTLYSGNSKYSVILHIGKTPNFSNEVKYFSALDKVVNKIENGALVGTDGCRFELNKTYFNSMKKTFVTAPKIEASKPVKKPVVKQNTSITVPNTNGKVKIYLPSNVASRIEFASDGSNVINKNAYKQTRNLDYSTIMNISLQPYVGTNKHHHNFAECNTYGTFIKNGRKYSLTGDYSFTSFRYDAGDALSSVNRAQMFVDLNALKYALENDKTSGLIH